MKTTVLLLAGLALALIASRIFAEADVTEYWNAALREAQETAHQDSAGRTKANAIIGAVFSATANGLDINGQPSEPVPSGVNSDAAAAQAAYSTLVVLYSQSKPTFDALLAKSLGELADGLAEVAAGREWGQHVALSILDEHQSAVAPGATHSQRIEQAASAPSIADPQPALDAAANEIDPGRYEFAPLAGEFGLNIRGYVDGVGPAARFDQLGGIVVDDAGNVYVSETRLSTIRKITPEGGVTTLAGAVGQQGVKDGPGSDARFTNPNGLAVDEEGNIFVADTGSHTIRKVSPSGEVVTVAGTGGASGDIDGGKAAARLNAPVFLARDEVGNLFVTESEKPGSVRKISPDGTVTTLIVGADSLLGPPGEICVDHTGNLYVNYWFVWEGLSAWGVYQLTPDSSGTYEALPFDPSAWSTCIDQADNLYVTNGGQAVIVYNPAGNVQLRYVKAGLNLVGGHIAVGKDGDLYTIPIYGTPDGLVQGAIGFGYYDSEAAGPIILSEPEDASKRVGDSVQFAASAIGTPAPTYQWHFNSSPISGATLAALSLTDVQPRDAGNYYVVISDSGGSVTSRGAMLTVREPSSPSGGTGSPGSGGGGTTGNKSGGGDFAPVFSIAMLVLLAGAAASRRRRKTRFSRTDSAMDLGCSGIRGVCWPISAAEPLPSRRAVAAHRTNPEPDNDLSNA